MKYCQNEPKQTPFFAITPRRDQGGTELCVIVLLFKGKDPEASRVSDDLETQPAG